MSTCCPRSSPARDNRTGPAPAKMPAFVGDPSAAKALSALVYAQMHPVDNIVTVAAPIAAPDGAKIYDDIAACSACHRLGGVGSEAGPALDAYTNRDAAWWRKAILEPSREIAPGYADIMPSYATLLDATQLDALIAYLQLRTSAGASD